MANSKGSLRRRVRPRAPRMSGDARRQEILRCALRAFSRASYARVTTAEIAREAAISEAALYKHFASKKELFIELVRSIGDRMIAKWQEIAAGAPTPGEALRLIGRRHLEKALANKDYTVVMSQAFSEVHDEEVRSALSDVYGRYVDFLEKLVAGAGGKRRSNGARFAAWSLVSLGSAMNLFASIDLDVDLIRGNLDKFCRHFLDSNAWRKP